MRPTTSYVSLPYVRDLFAHARRLKTERLRAEQGLPPRLVAMSGTVRKTAACAKCGLPLEARGDKGAWVHVEIQP